MLAEKVDYVIGVDTHRDQHTLAVVTASTGAVVAQHAVGTTIRGYAAAVAFAERYAVGVRVWAVEGAGHYGAGFTRYLSSRGQTTDIDSATPSEQEHAQGFLALAGTRECQRRAGERRARCPDRVERVVFALQSISRIGRPLDTTSATASRRNASGYGLVCCLRFDINTILPPDPDRPSAQVSTKPGELHSLVDCELGSGCPTPPLARLQDRRARRTGLLNSVGAVSE